MRILEASAAVYPARKASGREAAASTKWLGNVCGQRSYIWARFFRCKHVSDSDSVVDDTDSVDVFHPGKS